MRAPGICGLDSWWPISSTRTSRFVSRTSSNWSPILAINRAAHCCVRPRYIKSHQYFDHRYQRIVYVVRDPRDVALSYYHFQRKYRHIDDAYPLERYVEDFVNGTIGSEDWGTWKENVASWVATRGEDPDFLLLRYEDMVDDTPRQLRRLAAFLGIEASPERMNAVIEMSAAGRLRKLEKEDAQVWVGTKNRRQDIPMIRVATSGGWRSALPESCVARVEQAWGELMITLGYKLVTTDRVKKAAVALS